MTKAVLVNPVPRPSIKANSAEIEQIDLSDLEYSIGEALETPALDALRVFEGFSLFEYSPFDELGEYTSPQDALNDADYEAFCNELLVDDEEENRYEWIKCIEPHPDQFRCYEDYENARWGWDSCSFSSGTEQAALLFNQMAFIKRYGNRWVVPSTSGQNSKVYDIRWAYACKESFSNLPDVSVYTANQLSDTAGVSTKTLKKIMKYAPGTPFVQISARYFMSIDDYTTLTEHHPEAFTMIKDYPMAGCKYIRSLKTFPGNYPNGRELRKCIGQNGFETLVKYKVLKSMRTLGHRFGYYYYRTPEKSWLKVEELPEKDITNFIRIDSH